MYYVAILILAENIVALISTKGAHSLSLTPVSAKLQGDVLLLSTIFWVLITAWDVLALGLAINDCPKILP
jgi:hypothetical protein